MFWKRRQLASKQWRKRGMWGAAVSQCWRDTLCANVHHFCPTPISQSLFFLLPFIIIFFLILFFTLKNNSWYSSTFPPSPAGLAGAHAGTPAHVADCDFLTSTLLSFKNKKAQNYGYMSISRLLIASDIIIYCIRHY